MKETKGSAGKQVQFPPFEKALAMSNPVKYTSPSKTSPFRPDSPQMPHINTQPETLTRRVWVRRQDGNPTSLYVKETHIVDDLKTMIVDKFPTTLAKIIDPADVIIRVGPNLRSPSPNTYVSPTSSTPARKYLQPLSTQNSSALSPSFNSPLSPIPVSAMKSSLINQKPPVGEFATLSLKSSSPANSQPPVTLLEPDRPVWNVLDCYFPNGMSVENAFIVEVPQAIYQQYQYHNGVPTPTLNPSFPYSNTGRKCFSTDTITEGREEDFPVHNPRRPGSQSTHRGPTPTFHRRSQSNPAEHASAVLLLPSQQNNQGDWKRVRRGNSDATNDAMTYQDTDPQSQTESKESLIARQKEESPNAHTRNNSMTVPRVSSTKLGKGTSTMAKVLPSVNVLVVEDNLVNLRILSAHLRRHKIHYETAKNGQEAIDKWRTGGFHLVLMDIQLPVMSGLDAAREIRRLEKVNHIGVFANSDLQNMEPRKKEDNLELVVFRSPVIIVALTASNLKQDKQEALAAGCNDYLTKPVNLDWLLNKITEWGCMQALIDFDGWKSGERMTNIAAAIPNLTRKSSSIKPHAQNQHNREKEQF